MKRFSHIPVICLISVLAGSSAHADLSSAFKACANSNITARAVATWDPETPVSQLPTLENGKAVCQRSDWEPSAKVESSSFEFVKIGIDGSSASLLGFNCTGDSAKDLFEEIARFLTSQHTSVWHDGTTVISRTAGQELDCNRRIREADGSEANFYWCNFTFRALSGDLVKALNL